MIIERDKLYRVNFGMGTTFIPTKCELVKCG